MPEKWTGTLVGKMHNECVSVVDLANELGVSRSYVWMILNGARKPPNAKKRLNDAFDAIVQRRVDERAEQ